MSEKIVQLNEEVIKGQIKELVRGSVEETLNELLEQVKTEQVRLRKAEFELLQSQINPHFLYNTLDAIVWLAEAGEQKKVVSMVGSLSDFFRISLNQGQDILDVREELQHVRSYLEIQQMRYQDILQYEICVPEELYSSRIPKITLQPLVENAIQYGLGKDEKITMRIFEDNRRGLAAITIADSGNGLTIEEINQINAPFDYNLQKMQNGNRGIGLRYVKAMLDSFYEGQTNLFVNCKKGHGTKITILIPVQEELRDKAKVTDTGIE